MRLIFILTLLMHSIAYADITLKRLDGQTIPFSSLKGKWVMINYWASWCAPCLDEIKHFNRLANAKQDHVHVFAVNFDVVSEQEQRKLASQYQIHYPSLTQNPAKDLSLGSIRGVPVTFVFNPQGKLHTTLYGGQSYDNLLAALRE